MTNFADPTTLPDDSADSESLFTMHDGEGHVPATNRMLVWLRSLGLKVGSGSVNAPTVGAGRTLVSLTDGTTEWLPLLIGRNKVRNAAMQVAQRGATPVPTPTDNLYGLDGWRVLLEAANAATVTQDTADVPTGAKYAQKLVVGSGNNNKFGVFQPIEQSLIGDFLDLGVGSLQAKLKATAGIANVRMAVMVWTGTADATTADPLQTSWNADGTNPTPAGSWVFVGTPVNLNVTTAWPTTPYKLENVAIASNATNLGVLIWSDDKTTTQTTDILRIADVQFEPGKVCTAFERLHPAMAATVAGWYLRVFGRDGITNEAFLSGSCDSASSFVATQLYPEMRTAPGVTFSGATDFAVGGTLIASVAMTASAIGRTACRVVATVTSGLTTNAGSYLSRNGSAAARIILSAEI